MSHGAADLWEFCGAPRTTANTKVTSRPDVPPAQRFAMPSRSSTHDSGTPRFVSPSSRPFSAESFHLLLRAGSSRRFPMVIRWRMGMTELGGHESMVATPAVMIISELIGYCVNEVQG